jgi:hypothetical protein
VNLKQVLILANYFPPCNLTPSERIFSFASHLNEFGYYPIVVTRNWNVPIHHARDEYRKTGDQIVHEKNKNFEVYYVPFKPTLKDILFKKFYGTNFYFLYLFAALIYSFTENFSSFFTPYLSLYKVCKKVLQDNNNIPYLLISAGPFHLFKLGYKLHKKFNIKWIADYRDDWNTSDLMHNTFPKKLLRQVSVHYEKKWVGSASFFISVSDFYKKKISDLIKIPGYVVYNGYIESNYPKIKNDIFTQFTITYVGSLYNSQPVEIFLTAYKNFVNQNEIKPDSKVIFIGLESNPPLLAKVKKLVEGYEGFFKYTLRVGKQEAIAIQNKSTVLLAISHKNQKGIPGSKLYEYLALQKPVLICPSDHDIIEETLLSTNQAIITNNVEECTNKIQELYTEFLMAGKINIEPDVEVIKQYSRKAQVAKLASIMSKT